MYELVDMREALVRLKDKKLPLKTAYQLTKFIDATEKDIEFYYNELREILKAHAQLDENGEIKRPEGNSDLILLIEGHEEEANKALLSLRSLDVEVPELKLKIDELGDLEISLVEIGALSPILEE